MDPLATEGFMEALVLVKMRSEQVVLFQSDRKLPDKVGRVGIDSGRRIDALKTTVAPSLRRQNGAAGTELDNTAEVLW